MEKRERELDTGRRERRDVRVPRSGSSTKKKKKKNSEKLELIPVFVFIYIPLRRSFVRASFCLCLSPRGAMRRRTWKAAAASWKRSSRSESSSGSSCSTMPWSTSSIAIDALDRSTSLLAPPSRLGLRSRSFGGVPEGAQVFDR